MPKTMYFSRQHFPLDKVLDISFTPTAGYEVRICRQFLGFSHDFEKVKGIIRQFVADNPPLIRECIHKTGFYRMKHYDGTFTQARTADGLMVFRQAAENEKHYLLESLDKFYFDPYLNGKMRDAQRKWESENLESWAPMATPVMDLDI